MSCMPCRDNIVLKPGKNKIEFVKSSNGKQQNHNTDECSPFCSCTCCACINISFTQVTADKIILNSNNHFSVFIPSFVRKVALPIWQPPQIAA